MFNSKVYKYFQSRIVCMLSAEEIAERIGMFNLSKLSKATGIPQPTLWRMARYPEYGANYQTVKKLSDYLEGNK